MEWNHFDENGNAVMVDVSEKEITERIAVASGKIRVNDAVMSAIVNHTAKKGDVLTVARVAGIMGTKQTSNLIPMCHPLCLNKCTVDFEVKETEKSAEKVNGEKEDKAKQKNLPCEKQVENDNTNGYENSPMINERKATDYSVIDEQDAGG